jgi:FeS assembly SUF system protein
MSDAVVRLSSADDKVHETTAVPEDAPLQEKIIAALRNIYDPELPVNIYDLGLVYSIDIKGRDVGIVMTLTSPNCPVAGSMPAQVECAIKAFDEVDNVCVELTWDPPWDSNSLSDEVKLTLGLL